MMLQTDAFEAPIVQLYLQITIHHSARSYVNKETGATRDDCRLCRQRIYFGQLKLQAYIRALEDEVEDHPHALAVPLVLIDAVQVKLPRPKGGTDVVAEVHVAGIDAQVAFPLEEARYVLPQAANGPPEVDRKFTVAFALLFRRSCRTTAC